MRAWMFGCLLGTLAAAFAPRLMSYWLVVCLILIALGLLCVSRQWRALFTSSLLLTLAFTSLRGQDLLQTRLEPACNRQTLWLTGRVSSLPRKTRVRDGVSRQRFEFSVENLLPAMCSGPRTVLLSYYGREGLTPGERRQFEVTLRRPWGLANPGSFNMQGWYTLSGIDAVGSVRGEGVLLQHAGTDAWNWHHRLRQSIAAAIDNAALPVASAAVLKALTVADKSGIDHQLWRLFQQFGLNHLLVISGLHVALVAALAYLAGRLLRAALQLAVRSAANWPLPELGALSAAVGYAALAGFSVATSRALVMLACFLLARMTGRHSTGFNNLLLAATLLVTFNPMVVVGSGFWLSFGAVAGLLWLASWQARQSLMGKLWRPHLLMSLLMLPAGALFFGGISWVSAPANLLMVPLVGWIIVPLALLGAVLSVAGNPLAAVLWRIAAWPVDWLLAPALSLAEQKTLFLPISADGFALALSLLAVFLGLLPMQRRYRLVTLALFLPLLLPGRAADTTPRLSVLDAGQGTAVVFSAGARALLYDTGGGDPAGPNIANTVVIPWLRHSRLRSLQTLMVSHDDLDHSAGVVDVQRAMPVVSLLVGETLLPGARACRAGMSWEWPAGIRFQVLSPGAAEEGNDASCVLLIDAPGMRVLLAGDIGVEQERELIRFWGPQLTSDVLLVGHHGSSTSTSQSWLNHVSPRIAVISAGYASRFGHPHADVLARLHTQGIAVRETALEGR